LAQRRSTLLAERGSRVAQNHQREAHLADRIRSLSLETAQAAQEHALAKRRVELAQKSSVRFDQMAAQGFVSDIQAQGKQEELIDLQSRLENTLRSGSVLAREQNLAQADLGHRSAPNRPQPGQPRSRNSRNSIAQNQQCACTAGRPS
jgi:membrane fusion protein